MKADFDNPPYFYRLNVGPGEAGRYWCQLGDDQASVTVTVQTGPGEPPVTIETASQVGEQQRGEEADYEEGVMEERIVVENEEEIKQEIGEEEGEKEDEGMEYEEEKDEGEEEDVKEEVEEEEVGELMEKDEKENGDDEELPTLREITALVAENMQPLYRQLADINARLLYVEEKLNNEKEIK